ncbi:MAG: hypothetical protein MJ055_04895 [Phascolarctobacterium sp.]|nr:hypothetical protein [Phascolarctobacterium sp.]
MYFGELRDKGELYASGYEQGYKDAFDDVKDLINNKYPRRSEVLPVNQLRWAVNQIFFRQSRFHKTFGMGIPCDDGLFSINT